MTITASDEFETKLGTIRTWLHTENGDYIQQQQGFNFVTPGHSIHLQSFELNQIWTPEPTEYEGSKGWRWFIKKTNDQEEQLTIFCKLIDPSSDTIWGVNSGERLDAIEIENKTYHLHIGTEDGEMMQYRAGISDGMPERFKHELDLSKSFTEYIDFGFKTAIPNLEEGEKIYFHFIVATNTIKPHNQYPDERDVSTWLAVDQSKERLDEKLGSR